MPAVVTATALSSTLASLILGMVANLPMGMSPGMGLNAYLVFSQVLGVGVDVHAALAGCLVAAGLVAVLAVIQALRLILAAVPDAIKLATVRSGPRQQRTRMRAVRQGQTRGGLSGASGSAGWAGDAQTNEPVPPPLCNATQRRGAKGK